MSLTSKEGQTVNIAWPLPMSLGQGKAPRSCLTYVFLCRVFPGVLTWAPCSLHSWEGQTVDRVFGPL